MTGTPQRSSAAAPAARTALPAAAAALSQFLGVDHRTVWPALGCGLIVSLAILVPVVAYPSLVFSGPLQAYSGIGVGLGLLSAVVLTLALVVGGSVAGTVAVAQSEPAVVLGVVAASMAAEMQAAGAGDAVLPTIAATITIASLSAGLVFILLGSLRLANLIRFVPYPLIVGFIGGMGWLLIGGAVRVTTSEALSLDSLPRLLEGGTLIRWLPALAAGLGLWLLQKYRPRPFNVPGAAFGIIIAFWGCAWLAGQSHPALIGDGWMLSAVPPLQSWLPMYIRTDAASPDWGVMLAHWPQILTLMTVTLMGVLMQASVIEIAARTDVDLNRELRTLGLGNLVCTLGGSLPGYHSLSTSLLSLRLGRPVRAVSLTVAAVTALIFAFGGDAVTFVPKLAIGALLFYVGIDVFTGALLNVHLRRAASEYAVAMLVFGTVAFVGLLQGLAVGVIAGVILFVVKYSQVDVVRREATAVERHSAVVRPPRARQLLNETGDRVLVCELQGYIFFGTSNLLVNRIRERIAAVPGHEARFVILDFRRVTGIDSSVALSLGRLARTGTALDFTLIVTAVPPGLRGVFEQVAAVDADPGRIRLFPDLDHGLQHAEDRLLALAAAEGAQVLESLEQRLHAIGGGTHDIARLLRYVERETFARGTPLIQQGAQSRDLFFVERGSVTARLVLPGGRSVRLRTMGAGTVVGEVAVYLDLPRSASVIADEETEVLRVSGEGLSTMQLRDPGAAALLHAFMARELADKLVACTQQLAAHES